MSRTGREIDKANEQNSISYLFKKLFMLITESLFWTKSIKNFQK